VLNEIGRPDVAELPWFRDATERSRRVDELYDILAEAMPARTTAEWLATFERLDIPHSPVRSPQDLLDDPHLDDVGFFACNFADETPVKRTLRQAVSVDGVAGAPDLAPRQLGADTEAVLREAGCTQAEIAAAVIKR
jgi:crotonobetainyl-CoA:carnitine CoA-transferase CaiB-like acyl-CoA transferase